MEPTVHKDSRDHSGLKESGKGFLCRPKNNIQLCMLLKHVNISCVDVAFRRLHVIVV